MRTFLFYTCMLLGKLTVIARSLWFICSYSQRLRQRHHDNHMSVQSCNCHYIDIIMGVMAPQITSLMIVYSTVYSGADQRKHQSSASLAFVRGIYRGPVNSPHKWPATQKIVPFDVIMIIDTAPSNNKHKWLLICRILWICKAFLM